ncbi:MAG: SIR2 family protein [Candidatus Microthrix sp.]|jgi:hypothetical protein|nr:SIR2 family protein [Candidatus Microthrix sp.]
MSRFESLPEPLVAAAARGELVLLVGSGMSRQADPTMPNWRQLLERLTDHAASTNRVSGEARAELLELISGQKYLAVAEELREVMPLDEFRAQLELEIEHYVRPSEAHKLLWELEPEIVLTTNYDRFLEHTFAAIRERSVRVLDYTQAPQLQRLLQSSSLSSEDPVVVHLHGSVADTEKVILSERDYRHLLYEQPGYRMVLSALFITRTVLMLGFSVDDRELLALLEMLRQSLKDGSSPDYALIPTSAGSVSAGRLRKDFGVDVIGYEPADDTHAEVIDFLTTLKSEADGLRATGP